ncbi:hypothetical protein M9H77_36568 [Catharanthus roseus]|uniref:Uncharacterized protein n=1 Tax=Catharanthus roseus TaxID=4058 RepID=A0ACB9ZT03_CATRO|nr:hypothetical protein M9H77_36568 [Catharanthus roseus]
MKLQLEEMGGEADTLYMKNKATFGCCRLLLVFSQLYKYTTSSAHLTSIYKILRAHFNSRIIMSSLPRFLLLSLLLNSIFFFIHTCADEEETLLQQINSYRASLNLTTLRENDNAKCLANGLADKLKDQPCTNSTGANTIPGNEPQLSDYPNVLSKCHLNVTVTRDGAILPACVPNLTPTLVLSNFTQSQYASSLNDTKYTGIGIGSEDNWIVVVLTTNTPEGSFVDGDNNSQDNASLNGTNSANLISFSKIGLIYSVLSLFAWFFVLI